MKRFDEPWRPNAEKDPIMLAKLLTAFAPKGTPTTFTVTYYTYYTYYPYYPYYPYCPCYPYYPIAVFNLTHPLLGCVYDFFAGTASSCLAAIMTGRTWWGFDKAAVQLHADARARYSNNTPNIQMTPLHSPNSHPLRTFTQAGEVFH